ncbi:hypothetical protein BF698P1_00041 [Bacteroides phage BF698P1]|nr:hypothetical protein BF698P1_00041 [Bacteroides phage BF698P1]WAX07351.1 hypothetical protein BF698P3_00041 [Bacteroides phage BF698P3]
MEIEKYQNRGGKVALSSGVLPSFVERNRELIQSNKIKQLSKVDQRIFAESTRKLISEEESEEKKIEYLGIIFIGVCSDFGLNAPERSAVKSVFSSIFDVVDLYFDDLSFAEVKLAWRLLAVGELDNYLPKDRYGSPDKNHYGSFNVDYVTKVLKAYRKRKADMMSKTTALLPDKPKATPEQERAFLNVQANNFIFAIMKYKYSGRFKMESDRLISESTFKYMERLGYDMDTIPTYEDKKLALAQFKGRPINSFAQVFEKECLSTVGIEHEAVYFRALMIAKKRLLFRYWDEMLIEEDSIKDLYYYKH